MLKGLVSISVMVVAMSIGSHAAEWKALPDMPHEKWEAGTMVTDRFAFPCVSEDSKGLSNSWSQPVTYRVPNAFVDPLHMRQWPTVLLADTRDVPSNASIVELIERHRNE
jgi:hypothetical protein